MTRSVRLSAHFRYRPRVPERLRESTFVDDDVESTLGRELPALVGAPDFSHEQAATGDEGEGATTVTHRAQDAGDGSVGPAMGTGTPTRSGPVKAAPPVRRVGSPRKTTRDNHWIGSADAASWVDSRACTTRQPL